MHSNARTARIPTSPGTYLTDVRDDACKKFNVKPDQYTLKFNNKSINLSQQIRLANLPQGARLELVQSSRSPTVISVALQLPESEKSVRLTQKFASNTSLWEALRHFESDSETSYNFTQRGVPQISSNGTSGAGRLNYEMPVITVLPGHRERSSFVELQQTLSQLGFDSGSVLLRLSFKNSGTPLEEAMAEISRYFKGTEEPPAAAETASASGAHAESAGQFQSAPDPGNAAPEAMDSIAGTDGQNSPPEPMDTEPTPAPEPQHASSEPEPNPALPTSAKGKSAASPPPTSPTTQHIQIFAPPSSSTPQAARQAYNDADYIPTIEHAKAHQAALQSRTRNTRLPSDRELAEQESARLAKLTTIADRGVTLRIRLPDESQVVTRFGASASEDTAASLYAFVRGLIEHADQPFLLRYIGPKGTPVVLKEGAERLVQDLRFSGREVVTFLWDERASPEARLARRILRREWLDRAQVLRVEEPVGGSAAEEVVEKGPGKGKVGGGGTWGADKESKLKSILGKGFFKR